MTRPKPVALPLGDAPTNYPGTRNSSTWLVLIANSDILAVFTVLLSTPDIFFDVMLIPLAVASCLEWGVNEGAV